MPKYLTIDVETTGLPRFDLPADADGQPRLATLAMILVDEKLAVEREISLMVKPDGWVMPPEASAINGLTTEQLLAEGLPVQEVLAQYVHFIDAPESRVVVGFNVTFDLKVCRGALRRAGFPDRFETTANICCMRPLVGVCKLPKAKGDGYKLPKLAEAMAHFKIPQEGAHTAMGDARAALALLRKMVEIGACPEPAVHYAKEGTKAGKANAARKGVPGAGSEPELVEAAALPIAQQEIPL